MAAVDGFIEPNPESKSAERPEFAPERLRRSAIISTLDEVIERLWQYEALGLDEYGLWIVNSMSHEAKAPSLKLFIEEVVPAFRR